MKLKAHGTLQTITVKESVVVEVSADGNYTAEQLYIIFESAY